MITRLAALTMLILAAALGVSAAAKDRPATAARACSGAQYPATRDPANPLMLSQAPGSDPLVGAPLFVDGPRHGAAAGAIAKLLGMDPKSFPDDEAWSTFDSQVVPKALRSHPQAAYQVHMLEKIAREPEVQRLSEFTGGGRRGALLAETQKILCGNLTADPGAIPVFNTIFALPHGKYCASKRQIAANGRTFKRQVREVARGIGRHPAIFLLELDGVATSRCLSRAARRVWERQVRFEIKKLSSLPHTVVYMEAGYSDANGPRYTARVLNALGIRRIRGFYTNDTHLNWTINEINWARQVSRLTHGAHFIVNTAQNGNGPKLNQNRRKHGNEDLCNPPGRGLGPPDTAQTGFPEVDAFLWTSVPGNSSGHCRGGPSSGTFWVSRGVDLAAHANDRLGPGYPSHPY